MVSVFFFLRMFSILVISLKVKNYLKYVILNLNWLINNSVCLFWDSHKFGASIQTGFASCNYVGIGSKEEGFDSGEDFQTPFFLPFELQCSGAKESLQVISFCLTLDCVLNKSFTKQYFVGPLEDYLVFDLETFGWNYNSGRLAWSTARF